MKSLLDVGLLFFRVAISVLMMVHGFGKLQMLLGGKGADFMPVFGLPATLSLILAIIGEFVAPILIIIGFKTRLAAIPAAITMAVAVFIAHGGQPLAEKELAVVYLVAFVALAFTGAGKLSVDKK
ncbi:putative oxidoreductase [Pustulibacterium marinum]|uniref:Putative oxidoreductase n=1 Tax=Pustulibacterium marinum TaxID=1224947 RepID=A0A1I7GZU6_9FLAO|nr:DoxX family protein [Pustulibacterium marinum]SFU53920.1 putative oxidoreductase [Pustulibacterium marinum]